MPRLHHFRTVPVLALLASTFVVAGTGRAAAVDVSDIVSANDPAGDVRLLRGQRLSLAEKRSIDVRGVTVRRVDRKARIVIKIKQIVRVKKFDQMFFVELVEPMDPVMGAFETQIGFTSNGKQSYAIIADREDPNRYDECDDFPVAVSPLRKTVTATVPWKCTPDHHVKIKVSTVTGLFRSDARTYSSDRLAVPGYHQIL